MPVAKLHFLIATITGIVLYLLTGFLSAYLFHRPDDSGTVAYLMPGLLFTSATVIVFVLARTAFSTNILLWYVAMYATYFCVLLITLLSVWFAVIVGIATCGLGALATFWLTDRYIRKMSYNKGRAFISGALAFILNDLLTLTPAFDFLMSFFKIDHNINTVFAGTFLFWQSIVGIKLLLALKRNPD